MQLIVPRFERLSALCDPAAARAAEYQTALAYGRELGGETLAPYLAKRTQDLLDGERRYITRRFKEYGRTCLMAEVGPYSAILTNSPNPDSVFVAGFTQQLEEIKARGLDELPYPESYAKLAQTVRLLGLFGDTPQELSLYSGLGPFSRQPEDILVVAR